MKILTRLFAACGLAAALIPSASLADLQYMTFDSDAQGFPCGGWGAERIYEWDANRDSLTNLASGSLKVSVFFTNEPNTTLQTCVGVADLTLYSKLRLDLYLDPTNAPNANGHYGKFEVRFRPGFAWPGDVIDFGNITNTGWIRLEAPIPATATSASGINFHWSTGNFNGERTLWIDNIIFVSKDFYYMTFDTGDQGFPCGGWDAERVYSWDSALDAQTNASSGALKVDVYFTNAPNTTIQTCVAIPDLLPYGRIRMSVYLDPTNAPNSSGDFGTMEVRFRPGFAWPGDLVSLGTISNTGWTTLEAPLPASRTSASGINFHWTTGGFNNHRTIWIDNIIFINAPPAPPSLLLEKAGPGLEIVTSGSGQYSRKNVSTSASLANVMPWVLSTGEVTYEMSVSESVRSGSAGYAMNIMLIGTQSTAIGGSPDWNEPNGIFMEAVPNNAGSIDVSVRYKTNAPGAHGIRFEASGLLIATNTSLTSLVGTWGLTLKGTTVKLSGPGGISGTAELPSDVPSLFAPNLFALFGAQPYGQLDRRITLNRVRVYGSSADFWGTVDQDFTKLESLDTNILELKEEDAGGVRLHPTNTIWRVSWGVPDTGFKLWSSPTLIPSAWKATGLEPVKQGSRQTVFITSTNVSGSQYFFRLQQ